MKKYLYTEQEYSELVNTVLKTWQPVFYEDPFVAEHTVLWRHDVDYSPQRALALAKIEAAQGMAATYFFQLRSLFYNILEPGMDAVIKEITRLGHRIGVHFDPAPYVEIRGPDVCVLTKCLEREKDMLENCFSIQIGAFSFHNPVLFPSQLNPKEDHIAGMVNAGGQRIQQTYAYASDSRGGWRRADLPAMVENTHHKRLHVLTHPCRWTPSPLSVEGMLRRHLDGHIAKLHKICKCTVDHWDNPLEESKDIFLYEKIKKLLKK